MQQQAKLKRMTSAELDTLAIITIRTLSIYAVSKRNLDTPARGWR
jgi:hypothetical protein